MQNLAFGELTNPHFWQVLLCGEAPPGGGGGDTELDGEETGEDTELIAGVEITAVVAPGAGFPTESDDDFKSITSPTA